MNEEMPFRNIVICSDGTGNTFDESVSNVTRLIKHIELDNAQVALYDQGIGTNSQRLQRVNPKREATTRNDVASQNAWAMSGSLSKEEHG